MPENLGVELGRKVDVRQGLDGLFEHNHSEAG